VRLADSRERVAVLQRSAKYVGRQEGELSDASIHLVQFEDAHAFGETYSRGLSWHASLDSIPIERGDVRARALISIHLLFGKSDGRLLAAFTQPKEEWVLPVIETRDPELEAVRDGWSVSQLPGDTDVHATLPAVLSVLWGRLGIHPGSAGQIIMRPRMVDAAMPQRQNAETGAWEPVLKPAIRWIVEVLGTMHEIHGPGMDADGGYYMSGLIMLVEDQPTEGLRVVFMP
jgi:hypothetical protein